MTNGRPPERSFDERPVAEGGGARPLLGPAPDGFVARHDLWGDGEHAAAAQLRRVVDERGVDLVRVSFADQHGVLHGKTVTRDALEGALTGAVTAPSSLLLKDTSGQSAYPVFSPGGGIGSARLAGAGDVVLVPDPKSFRVLPWSPRTGWLLCDLYYPDGEPVALSTRGLLRRTLQRLHAHGQGLTVGVELEFHVVRVLEPLLGDEHVSAPGRPGAPRAVGPVHRGAQLMNEESLDALDPLVRALHDSLWGLDLPLRSIELEFGPNQLEVTLAPRPALQAADDVVRCRAAIRAACRRLGYHATFMSRPRGATAASAGWHLHQSLVDVDSGANAFADPGVGGALSALGRGYLAGLLTHARGGAVFSTPTINGYKRYRPVSLAPDRVCWGLDNRGAMIRVIGDPAGAGTRIENRAGDSAANPYLFIASQIVAGLDGIERELDPGPPTDDPYAGSAPRLPSGLGQALDALAEDEIFAGAFGAEVVDWLIALKRHELARCEAEVSEWEQREYFDLL